MKLDWKWIALGAFVGFLIFQTSKLVRAFSKTAIEEVSQRYHDFIDSAASITGIPYERILAHIIVESDGDPSAKGFDSAGSVGLMQITPIALQDVNESTHSTYTMQEMREPFQNIVVGATLLSLYRNRLSGNLDLASQAFNVGIGRVSRDNTAGEDYLSLIHKVETIEKET